MHCQAATVSFPSASRREGGGGGAPFSYVFGRYPRSALAALYRSNPEGVEGDPFTFLVPTHRHPSSCSRIRLDGHRPSASPRRGVVKASRLLRSRRDPRASVSRAFWPFAPPICPDCAASTRRATEGLIPAILEASMLRAPVPWARTFAATVPSDNGFRRRWMTFTSCPGSSRLGTGPRTPRRTPPGPGPHGPARGPGRNGSLGGRIGCRRPLGGQWSPPVP
jgi:hypothetical protein